MAFKDERMSEELKENIASAITGLDASQGLSADTKEAIWDIATLCYAEGRMAQSEDFVKFLAGKMSFEELMKGIKYEFTMKENGKILYQQDVHGGVLSIVEEIEDIDDNGALTGVAQSFFFGHPLVLWFGYDQLTKSMEGKRMEIMGEFRKGIESRQFADPLVKARLIAVANHSLKK